MLPSINLSAGGWRAQKRAYPNSHVEPRPQREIGGEFRGGEPRKLSAQQYQGLSTQPPRTPQTIPQRCSLQIVKKQLRNVRKLDTFCSRIDNRLIIPIFLHNAGRGRRSPARS